MTELQEAFRSFFHASNQIMESINKLEQKVLELISRNAPQEENIYVCAQKVGTTPDVMIQSVAHLDDPWQSSKIVLRRDTIETSLVSYLTETKIRDFVSGGRHGDAFGLLLKLKNYLFDESWLLLSRLRVGIT